MADAKKCDRCGKYYPVENRFGAIVNPNGGFNGMAFKRQDNYQDVGKYYDLCPTCCHELSNWWNNVIRCEKEDVQNGDA